MNQPDQNLQTLLPEHLQVSDCISRANFSELAAKPAVYVLVSTQNTPILLAATSDLRRAVQNRLLPPAALVWPPSAAVLVWPPSAAGLTAAAA